MHAVTTSLRRAQPIKRWIENKYTEKLGILLADSF